MQIKLNLITLLLVNLLSCKQDKNPISQGAKTPFQIALSQHAAERSANSCAQNLNLADMPPPELVNPNDLIKITSVTANDYSMMDDYFTVQVSLNFESTEVLDTRVQDARVQGTDLHYKVCSLSRTDSCFEQIVSMDDHFFESKTFYNEPVSFEVSPCVPKDRVKNTYLATNLAASLADGLADGLADSSIRILKNNNITYYCQESTVSLPWIRKNNNPQSSEKVEAALKDLEDQMESAKINHGLLYSYLISKKPTNANEAYGINFARQMGPTAFYQMMLDHLDEAMDTEAQVKAALETQATLETKAALETKATLDTKDTLETKLTTDSNDPNSLNLTATPLTCDQVDSMANSMANGLAYDPNPNAQVSPHVVTSFFEKPLVSAPEAAAPETDGASGTTGASDSSGTSEAQAAKAPGKGSDSSASYLKWAKIIGVMTIALVGVYAFYSYREWSTQKNKKDLPDFKMDALVKKINDPLTTIEKHTSALKELAGMKIIAANVEIKSLQKNFYESRDSLAAKRKSSSKQIPAKSIEVKSLEESIEKQKLELMQEKLKLAVQTHIAKNGFKGYDFGKIQKEFFASQYDPDFKITLTEKDIEILNASKSNTAVTFAKDQKIVYKSAEWDELKNRTKGTTSDLSHRVSNLEYKLNPLVLEAENSLSKIEARTFVKPDLLTKLNPKNYLRNIHSPKILGAAVIGAVISFVLLEVGALGLVDSTDTNDPQLADPQWVKDLLMRVESDRQRVLDLRDKFTNELADYNGAI